MDVARRLLPWIYRHFRSLGQAAFPAQGCLLFILACFPLLGNADMDIATSELKREPVIDSPYPELKIEDYFQGRTWAWGIFEDRFGNVRDCFKVEMDGSIENNTLNLNERFTYADGSQSTREWQIKVLGGGAYEGTASDVIGLAKGRSQGNTFAWKYKLELPVSGRNIALSFDDRLYLQADGVLINIARVSKWGIAVGRMTFAFSKDNGLLAQACKPSASNQSIADASGAR